MVEGMTTRALAWMTGASKDTVVELPRDAGAACGLSASGAQQPRLLEHFQADWV